MKKILTLLFITIAVIGCKDGRKETVRSVYYWSTVFEINKSKSAFIKEHKIKKIYLRFFDVVNDGYGAAVPNATVKFNTAVPHDLEIVPVVFIVNNCMNGNTNVLAMNIIKRIEKMCKTNDVCGVKEIQIDCDWTNNSRNSFFEFCRHLKKLANSKGIKLSCTIRLHQLSQSAPPVDKGVLMMYNTGDFTNLECKKPILDIKDVLPYIKDISNYKLNLSTAYPIFGWKILFRNGHYVGIMHTDDELPVLNGDSIVDRQPELDDITVTKDMVEKKRSNANNEIILFDLNERNIKRYKRIDYEKIYNRNSYSLNSDWQ